MDEIDKMKSLIKDELDRRKVSFQIKSFVGFERTYFFTNENIKEYLTNIHNKNSEKVLTVLGSGDQLFNLISLGVSNIDTFDTNSFTEYYVFGLKKALILKYDYENFLNIISYLQGCNNVGGVVELLMNLLPYMDLKYRKFWRELIDVYYISEKDNKIPMKFLNLLFINIRKPSFYKEMNIYLQNKENYLRLKNNINKVNISFTNCNARTLCKYFNNSYDEILLSNILDYFYQVNGMNWKYDSLLEYEKYLGKLINKDGIIYLNYIFRYGDDPFINGSIVKCSSIIKEELQNEKILTFPSEYKTIQDGMLYLKK